jgi:hypothetical protein
VKKVYCLIAGVSVAALAGCDKGTSTAPPTGAGANRGTSEVRKLTVTSPGEQTVTQDRTDEMTISIDRDNFASPVEIELTNLPKGVSVVTKEMTIPADKDSLTVTVKAAPDAPPVDNHKARVVARPKNEAGLKEAAVEFDMDVKAKS